MQAFNLRCKTMSIKNAALSRDQLAPEEQEILEAIHLCPALRQKISKILRGDVSDEEAQICKAEKSAV